MVKNRWKPEGQRRDIFEHSEENKMITLELSKKIRGEKQRIWGWKKLFNHEHSPIYLKTSQEAKWMENKEDEWFSRKFIIILSRIFLGWDNSKN